MKRDIYTLYLFGQPIQVRSWSRGSANSVLQIHIGEVYQCSNDAAFNLLELSSRGGANPGLDLSKLSREI